MPEDAAMVKRVRDARAALRGALDHVGATGTAQAMHAAGTQLLIATEGLEQLAKEAEEHSHERNDSVMTKKTLSVNKGRQNLFLKRGLKAPPGHPGGRPLRAWLIGGNPTYSNVAKLPELLWRDFGIAVVKHVRDLDQVQKPSKRTMPDLGIVLIDQASHGSSERSREFTRKPIFCASSSWVRLQEALLAAGIHALPGESFAPRETKITLPRPRTVTMPKSIPDHVPMPGPPLPPSAVPSPFPPSPAPICAPVAPADPYQAAIDRVRAEAQDLEAHGDLLQERIETLERDLEALRQEPPKIRARLEQLRATEESLRQLINLPKPVL